MDRSVAIGQRILFGFWGLWGVWIMYRQAARYLENPYTLEDGLRVGYALGVLQALIAIQFFYNGAKDGRWWLWRAWWIIALSDIFLTMVAAGAWRLDSQRGWSLIAITVALVLVSLGWWLGRRQALVGSSSGATGA